MRAPRELRELRIGLVGSEELAAALGSACEVELLAPGDWDEQLAARPVHLLLVEAGERSDPGWLDQIEILLEACEGARVSRMLWVTTSPFDPVFLVHAERFDRGFSVGVGQLTTLLEAGFPDPSLLWRATALPVDDRPVPETAERSDPIVWLGDWREDWPEAWRSRLLEVLRAAAPRGLRIAGVAAPESLPEELRAYVRGPRIGRAEALERALLAIAADPVILTEDAVSALVFDALACGAAVVSPTGVGSAWDFCAGGAAGVPPHDLIPAVEDHDSAAAEIDRLLGDDVLREEVVHSCRRVVAYNHTYAHRAATLASAAGFRLLPDAAPHPAHS